MERLNPRAAADQQAQAHQSGVEAGKQTRRQRESRARLSSHQRQRMTAVLLSLSPPTMTTCVKKLPAPSLIPSSYNNGGRRRASAPRRIPRGAVRIQAFFNPFEDQPILKDAIKDPVAFTSGMLAGLLRLDLNEDPLREWIARTVEASGIAAEVETGAEGSMAEGKDDVPQQIEIE